MSEPTKLTSVQEQVMRDALVHGTGFRMVHDDGTEERIDPRDIAPTYDAILQRAKDEAWAVMDEQAKKIWLDRAKALLNGEEMLRKAEEKE